MAEQKKQDVNQLLKVRRDKLADLQANGRDPFQITKFDQTHHSLEVKNLYEAHEAELLKDRKELDVTGLDEEQAKEAQKKDYEERRSIMDASPIHVSIAGRMMFKRVPLDPIPMQILRNLISAIFLVWRDLLSEQEQVRSPFMQRR